MRTGAKTRNNICLLVFLTGFFYGTPKLVIFNIPSTENATVNFNSEIKNMQNQIREKVIAMKQKIRELDKTQTEILNRMASNGKSGTSILTAASKDILQLEESVSRVDTKSIEYANNLDNVTKQISNLLLKTSRLNVLVDNLQNKANLGERNSKDRSSDMSTNNHCCECSLNAKEKNELVGVGKIPRREKGEASDEDNTEYKSDNEYCSADANIHNLSSFVNVRTVGLLANAVQSYESNINPCKPLGGNSDTKFFKKLGICSDNYKGQNAFTNSTSSEESIVDENRSEEDNSSYTFNKKKDDENSSEIENCNTPNIKTTIRKNESGYKSKTIKTQNDNRVSFHTIHKSSGGCTKENVCRTDLQREYSNVSNIKPIQHITDEIRPMMKSVTSYSTARRSSRGRHEEDIYDERLFDAGQPKTVREWYKYTKHMTEYASARMRSGTVKLGRSPNVILVLDTSDRMTGYFQKLKSAALQYVYGIKQSSECGDIENGIGLAVFGRETRLIQEPTSDYELVIELIGHLRPEGDAPVLAGLLMGYAGVASCDLGCYKDIVLQAHMIVFTNGSSEQCKLSTENGENFIFAFRKSRVPSDINGVIDEIVSSTTKIFYVPIGGNQCNNILEQAVGKTNGKIIPVNEMYRLIRMTRVMLLAIQIASDIRYLKNQSREDIKRRISNHSSLDDKHEDCLDMVPDFINPLNFDNMRGLYLELGSHTLTLGDRVRRGPDWTYNDQDLSLPGTAVGYDRDGWVIVEWDHGNILPYPHDEQMDRLQIRKVNEPRILIDELIAVGCRVVRGRDWKYGDHDGGKGTEGTVLGVKQEDKVVVRWDGKKIGLYKIGHKGRFEVKLIDNYSNEDHEIGCEETDRYGHSEERFKEATTGKYQNAPYSMNANNCGPEDYVIPIYSETSISAIWEHQKGSQWTKYPSGVNLKIEKAYQRKKTGKIIIEIDRTTYIIHFSRMVQENAQNKTEMAVRRRGSRKIVISRSDSVINFKKRVIELFPKLERVDFEFFQAKLREKHRLEQVVFNSLKDLKAKVKFTLYIKPAQQLINITEGESDEEELPPLFPPRRERQSDDANLTVQASTSDTPDSPRSRQRNSTLSQPGTSGASTTVTSERSNSSSTQITSTLSSPGRNRATVALEGSNTPSSRRGRVIASPVARRSNATPRRTGLSSNSGRQRRRTAIAADDFIHAVVAPEASISPSTRRNRALSSPRVVASRSNVSETTTQAYHTAGTPTVLFRSTAVPTSTEQTATEQYEQLSTPVNPLSLMDVTRDLAVDVNNINAIFEDIPEVGLFGDIGQNECTENFRKKIKEHKELFIHNDSDDPLLMEVRRENPVQDSLAFISISQDDLHSPLRISFTDEDGVDLGGLRREFWSLFLHKISSSVFVTGKPGRQTLRDNFIARTQNIFFHLGQLVALSIIQDGPGLPIFSDIVTDYILLGKPCILNVDDLPEGLKNTIVMMQDCTSEPDLQNMYSGIFDEAVDAGFIIPPSSFKKKHVNILLAALLETQLNKCKKELDQFIKGLDTHQVLSLLKQDVNIACARTLFSGRVKPLTVQTLRNLLKFKYDTGNAALDQRATGQGFLTFLQATKGTSTVINGIDIGPKEVLMWLTGSTAIPAIGFHKPIDVCFGSRTFVNTCALALTLEVRPELAPAEAVKFYSEIIINSQTFTQE